MGATVVAIASLVVGIVGPVWAYFVAAAGVAAALVQGVLLVRAEGERGTEASDTPVIPTQTFKFGDRGHLTGDKLVTNADIAAEFGNDSKVDLKDVQHRPTKRRNMNEG